MGDRVDKTFFCSRYERCFVSSMYLTVVCSLKFFLPIVISEPQICPLSMLDVSVTPKLVLSFSNQATQTSDLVRQVIADPRSNKITF